MGATEAEEIKTMKLWAEKHGFLVQKAPTDDDVSMDPKTEKEALARGMTTKEAQADKKWMTKSENDAAKMPPPQCLPKAKQQGTLKQLAKPPVVKKRQEEAAGSKDQPGTPTRPPGMPPMMVPPKTPPPQEAKLMATLKQQVAMKGVAKQPDAKKS